MFQTQPLEDNALPDDARMALLQAQSQQDSWKSASGPFHCEVRSKHLVIAANGDCYNT